MKIHRITISNFRDIDHIDIDLADANALALFGRNGAGKSSIIYAVQMALLGHCDLTGADGRKAEALVREGSAEALVTVVTDRHRVDLTIKRAGKTKRTLAITDAETGEITAETLAEMWRACGIKPEHAEVCLMPRQCMVSGELGGVLADLSAGALTPAAVIDAALSAEHPATVTHEWLASMLGERVTPATLAAVGADCESRRRDVNRDLKRARDRAAELPTLAQPVSPSGAPYTLADRPKIEASLERLSSRRDELIAEKARAECLPDRAAVQADLDALDMRTVAAALQTASAAREEAERAYSDATTAATAARSDAATAQRALDALTGDGGGCPTCGREYTEDLRASLLAPLEQALHNAEARVEAAGVADTVLVRVEAGRVQDAAKAAFNDVAVRDRALRERLATCENTRVLADIQAELDENETTTLRGQDTLARINAWAETVAVQSEIDRLTDQLPALDWGVTAFRDGALVKSLAGDGLGEFIARASAVLADYGHALGVEVEGKNVTVTLDGRPVAHASRGEQLLAAFALGQTFADCGAPLVLDDLNDLDAVNRKRLLGSLRDAPGTVIAAAAWQQSGEDMEPVQRALAPVKVVWAM